MRGRRRRNRATWFPMLGFDVGQDAADLSILDRRELTVNATGRDVTIIPLLPDIDIPVSQSQTAGGNVETTLRDFVEGQSCIIERVVGSIQAYTARNGNTNTIAAYAFCAALAVVPIEDDGTGNPAVSSQNLDPLGVNNIMQPWLWRRTWCLGLAPDSGSEAVGAGNGYPQNNLFGSVADGPKVDTKGTRRVIGREERLFLIYSTEILFPQGTESALVNGLQVVADLRIIGRMIRSKNHSQFK